MSYLVVGIENRTSKKGDNYHLLHVSQPFTDVRYGVGSKTSVEYISNKYFPAGLGVGDTVEFSYGKSFDGKAYVNGVTISEDVPTIPKK
ncbi:MAG: hypothetical protein E7271_03510 [Lachnospiraceae bacterium]|jgi:hypothetical protein|nr:hypothetical protein [Lachnospiraceae bacterium]